MLCGSWWQCIGKSLKGWIASEISTPYGCNEREGFAVFRGMVALGMTTKASLNSYFKTWDFKPTQNLEDYSKSCGREILVNNIAIMHD